MFLQFITQNRFYNFVTQISDFKKQLIKFTLIGFSAVFVDLICYSILLTILPEKILLVGNETIAKASSFMCGMAVTYLFNKHWTWKQNNRSNIRAIKFMFLYGSSLIVNVSVNAILIYILHNNVIFNRIPFKYLVAFIGATTVSSCINFFGQKFWVFKLQNNEQDITT